MFPLDWKYSAFGELGEKKSNFFSWSCGLLPRLTGICKPQ